MPAQKSTQIKWTIRDFRNLFILEFAFLAGITFIAAALFGEGGPLSHFPASCVTVLLFLLQSLTLLVPLYFYTIFKYRSKGKDFGFVPVNKGTLKRVAQGFFIYYIVNAITIQIRLSYNIEIPGYGDQESHILLFGDDTRGLIMGFFIVVIIAPLVEELFFRGYIYQTLRNYGGVAWASIFSALIFALFHLEFQVIIPIFILGLVLNWVFEKSKSLWGPIAFHMINNGLAFLLEIAIYFEWIDLTF